MASLVKKKNKGRKESLKLYRKKKGGGGGGGERDKTVDVITCGLRNNKQVNLVIYEMNLLTISHRSVSFVPIELLYTTNFTAIFLTESMDIILIFFQNKNHTFHHKRKQPLILYTLN